MKGPFKCDGCGDEWAVDPRLAVDCPTCRAKVGVGCVRPSEHRGNMVQPHKARRTLAFEKAPCSCLARWEEQQRLSRKTA